MAENPMTAKEYLASKRKEIDEYEINNKKRAKKLKISAALFAAAFVLLTAASFIIGKASVIMKYNNYKNTEANSDIKEDIEMMEYKDAYSIFEDSKLGNSGNNIMNYGLVCQGSDFVVYNKTENGKPCLVMSKNNSERVICDSDAEYINTDDSYIYYVKNQDNCIYRNDMKGNEKKLVSDMSASEMILFNEELFFINDSDDQKIYSVKADGTGQPQKIVDDSAVKFTVSGENIIYIDYNNTIQRYDLESQSSTILQSNIEDFCYNGSIIALNNGKLISFNSFGKNVKLLTKGNIRLLNADSQKIYYSKGSALFEFDIDSGDETSIFDNYEIYKAVYKTDDKLFCYALSKNADNVYEENLEIKDL